MLTEKEQQLVNASKFAMQWLMNRVHIATSDFQVAKDIYRRIHEHNHGVVYSRELKKAMVRLALECHHENQSLYDFVMR